MAFGLPVPRSMTVTARFPDAVFATGELSLVDVVDYVRARVGPSPSEGTPSKMVFSKAILATAPDRQLRIEIAAVSNRTELVVRDVTPPKVEPMSPDERMKKAGLTPTGELLDPRSME